MARKKSNDGKSEFLSVPLFPFMEEKEAIDQTIKTIRLNEQKIRSTAQIYLDNPVAPIFPSIILPFRWEALEAEAHKRNVPLKPLIMPVQNAIAEVERELVRIKETGMGKLYVISGVTGSGKTTFLNSLHLFLDDVGVHSIKSMSLDRRESIEDALAVLRREKDKRSVVVLEGKEAPGSLKSDDIDVLLTTLNTDFRSGVGRRTLFVIPTTSQSVAQLIGERAANIGGMTTKDKLFFVFNGPSRNEYVSITNDTLRALNESKTLLEYGISDQIAKGIAEASESIGSFMSNCYSEIQKQRASLESFSTALKRKRVHLWMVFCSLEDTARRNHDIIRSLTVGDFQHAQVKRLLTGDSKEAKFWEDKQEVFSQASQYIDLRIMYLPLRTATAIATAYGHKEFIEQLKKLKLESGDRILKREAVRDSAQKSLASTAIGSYLRQEGFVDRDVARRRSIDEKQKEIFREIVKLSSTDDKAPNAMIAACLRDWSKDPELKISTQLSLNDNGSLVPDIAIVSPTDIYCLELKWRSSLLHEGEVVRETAERVKEFAEGLPELKNLLSGLR